MLIAACLFLYAVTALTGFCMGYGEGRLVRAAMAAFAPIVVPILLVGDLISD